MTRIPLTQGQFALVDDCDADLLVYKWAAAWRRVTYYAQSSQGYLHRVIGKRKGILENVEHKDLDGLNCTRDNLRSCNQSQNMANGNLRTNNKSGYKGVSWAKKNSKWQTHIMVRYKSIYLGKYVNVIEAAEAYDKAAAHYFGEYARLNFPKEIKP